MQPIPFLENPAADPGRHASARARLLFSVALFVLPRNAWAWPAAFLWLVLCSGAPASEPAPLQTAQETAPVFDPIVLPRPRIDAGKPLMRALQQRCTTREFRTNALSPQLLGELLWAAFGINRPATGHRTAPSAMNAQEVDIYIALPQGLYLYDPKLHQLTPQQPGDLRPLTGQAFSKLAPVTLIYIAELPRLTKAAPERRSFYATFDAGCISQNVYLYCASQGLATVVHDLDRGPLQSALKLRPDRQIILAQAVGLPAAPK